MAKKQKNTEVESTPQVVEQPKVETPVMEKPLPKKDTWEIKDRMYYLKGDKKPLSRMIKSADLYWFDKERGYEREIKYCENQQSCFVDEMQGDQRLSHIIFRGGSLVVPREKTVLFFGTISDPVLNIICSNLCSPFISSTKQVLWFFVYFNSLS